MVDRTAQCRQQRIMTTDHLSNAANESDVFDLSHHNVPKLRDV
jgi:hypothetical protein